MALPTDVDVSYPDRSPGDKAHQQHHDALHGEHNVIEGKGGAAALATATDLSNATSVKLDKETQQPGTAAAPTSTRLWSVQPADPAKGKFLTRIYGSLVNSTWDSIFAIGYNSDGSTAGEPSLEMAIEQDYETSPGVHMMEMYWQYGNAGRTTWKRPFFVSVNRDTDVIYTAVRGSSQVHIQDVEDATEWLEISATGLIVAQPDAMLRLTTHGRLEFGATGPSLRNTSAQPNMLYVRANQHLFQSIAAVQVMSVNAEATNTTVAVTAPSNGNRVMVLKQATGTQFFSVLEAQDSANNVLSKIDKNGYFMTRKKAAPADADVATSELALWFDDTSGAAKVMFKAKDSGGIVRTGSVALA